MKNIIKYLLIASVFGMVTATTQAQSSNAAKAAIVAAVKNDVKKAGSNQEAILEIVKEAVEENPEAAGEIVKAAIEASGASNNLVGQIVQTAGNAAPSQINAIVQFAIAAAPDAAAQINAAAANIQGSAGAGSGSNPLDAPGGTPAGQAQGENDGGSSETGPGASDGRGASVITPTPRVTDPNPRGATVTTPSGNTPPNGNNP